MQDELPNTLSLTKPMDDTKYANSAAKQLMAIIKENGWSKKLGGSGEHVQYEGWQTAGKFYGYSVKTHGAEFIEVGGVSGFKAKATVVNEATGIEIGGAEAFCMRDEPNWKNKPTFQLASMAQTRAGSKALRQVLGFVVALSGYNPTPAEEMEGEVIETKPEPKDSSGDQDVKRYSLDNTLATEKQVKAIFAIGKSQGSDPEHVKNEVKEMYGLTSFNDLTKDMASEWISAQNK